MTFMRRHLTARTFKGRSYWRQPFESYFD